MVDRVQEIEVFGTTSQEKICFPPDGQKNRNSPRVGFLSQLLLDKDENRVSPNTHSCFGMNRQHTTEWTVRK